ncbi:ANM_HP_G0083020.mRNA.1.CDS.1 [Saccharomyces cerevisiae]|nr:ANM_HP_G0203030.mRNA.1.CDS.1 [Saccharomyces cerevisiae]CAI5226448.1 ANM_HP_G0083020.mRNA.1.CDS.1 [Saccharomyces cerevisiae]CAI6962845.1 ANM_HP_G0203030.mRNA.1.CDS.1 [Saccharomyces cerevisiae]CAI7031264.1 ANM_HP_G0083020.mRNA.1.CDS.1 [Saccharomyces cerevisiae]
MPQSTPSQEVQRVPWDNKPALKQITLRATIAGIAIGSLVLTSNFQFGLQTGWVSMMSLPSALLACAFFKNIWPLIFPNDRPFSDVENVYVQSMAVAVGTGPLAFGFVGVIPAIEKFLTNDESGGLREQGQSFTFRELLIWSTALAFFGIFFAVPLRKQVIVREKLPFPSGSATATLISVLNGTEILQEVSKSELLEMRQRRLNECPEVLQPNRDPEEADYLMNSSHSELGDYTATSQDGSSILSTGSENYRANIIILLKTFVVSSLYTMVSYFVPVIRSIPVFGKYLSNNYLWNFQPSPAYIG